MEVRIQNHAAVSTILRRYQRLWFAVEYLYRKGQSYRLTKQFYHPLPSGFPGVPIAPPIGVSSFVWVPLATLKLKQSDQEPIREI